MAGHSKWHQIKHKKKITDKKRGVIFSKLLLTIQVAAKENPNPKFNPKLRAVILKAKENNVPQENIEKAIKKAKESPVEELIIEAYGPEGTALIIQILADNKNRVLSEIKNLLLSFDAKIAEPGSVKWIFETSPEMNFVPKFKQLISNESKEKTKNLLRSLDEKNEVINIYINADL
ncbi:MAG: YebC/PmpR family DNA-binding transcriptional regulator [Candidatus Liptonbacteria bacterium]|nr:YebC/PmpR family DNA-binding transcriptional regulator [Candidatus Liptonbacteria bacterium]